MIVFQDQYNHEIFHRGPAIALQKQAETSRVSPSSVSDALPPRFFHSDKGYPVRLVV
jgi:hypothetical protein